MHRLLAAALLVSAAASLQDALRDIAPRGITFNFGASGTLARQIEAGAPADVFLSADERTMDTLERKHLVVDRRSILSNELVVVSNERIARAEDLAKLKAVAIGEPGIVPAGTYAKAWLDKRHIRANLVPTANVRAALAAVESGNVDAAIVYRSDARIAKKVRVAFEIKDGPPISYSAAVVASSKQRTAARRFLDSLRTPAAVKIFQRYGFVVK